MSTKQRNRIGAVGIFCGSSAGASEEFAEAAKEVGRLLSASNVTMIFGGGSVGLMGVIADEMIKHKGKIVGVIPKQLIDKELAHKGVHDMRIVDGMSERKALIHQLSDAYIALPGGYGTLDEIFEMLTLFQLGISEKPCALLNTRGYYDFLIKQLDHFVNERFLKSEHRKHLLVHKNPDMLLKAIEYAHENRNNHDTGWIESLKNTNTY